MFENPDVSGLQIHAARERNLWYPGYNPSSGRDKSKNRGDLLTASARGRGEGKRK